MYSVAWKSMLNFACPMYFHSKSFVVKPLFVNVCAYVHGNRHHSGLEFSLCYGSLTLIGNHLTACLITIITAIKFSAYMSLHFLLFSTNCNISRCVTSSLDQRGKCQAPCQTGSRDWFDIPSVFVPLGTVFRGGGCYIYVFFIPLIFSRLNK